MKSTILTLAAIAVAAAQPISPLQARQDLLPASTSPKPESVIDAIPINIVTSLRRPNGDVIGILKPRTQVPDAIYGAW